MSSENACFRKFSLVEDYQDLIPSFTLPDPGDRHVLAAAVKARADAIITFNLRDFPESVLKPYMIEAVHPDDFILDVANSLTYIRLVGGSGLLAAP